MASKLILVACFQAILIQAAYTQLSTVSGYTNYGGNVLNNGFSGNTLGNAMGGTVVNGVLGSGLASGIGGTVVNSGLGGSVLSGTVNSGIGGSVLSGTVNSGLGGSLSSGLAGLNTGKTFNVVSGGPLVVTSISPIGPSGLAVTSENGLEGVLTVSGQLPFLSAVAFEGGLPTSGSGVATCGCGGGEVGIVSEGFGNSAVGSGVGSRRV